MSFSRERLLTLTMRISHQQYEKGYNCDATHHGFDNFALILGQDIWQCQEVFLINEACQEDSI
jgi:hypothetical protein